MADEFAVTATLNVTKGEAKYTRTKTVSPDLVASSLRQAGGVVSVPTTAAGTALGVTGLTTAGWSYFVNVDTTNYVELGIQQGGVFYPFAKLKPGEPGVIRLGTNTPYARANTAAAVLEYTIFED